MSKFIIHYPSLAELVRAEKAFKQRTEGAIQTRRRGCALEITPPPLTDPLISVSVLVMLGAKVFISVLKRLIQRRAAAHPAR